MGQPSSDVQTPGPWEPLAGGSASLPLHHPYSDLALPRVRLILGGGSPLCRLSEGLSQLTTQLPFQRLPRDVAVRIWNLERNLLVSHSSYLTMTGCMGPRSIQEEILIKEKWPFG